jgi:hypothetical protein
MGSMAVWFWFCSEYPPAASRLLDSLAPPHPGAVAAGEGIGPCAGRSLRAILVSVGHPPFRSFFYKQ